MSIKEKRTVLVIGRTGNGKSTVCNVIAGKLGLFRESESAASCTKTYQKELFVDAGCQFELVDTIGIGDTQLTDQEVLNKIADACYAVRDGIHQVFFVTRGKFTAEEILAFRILTEVIFDKRIMEYTTIIRTSFPSFRNAAKCEAEKEVLRNENSDLRQLMSCCKAVLFVNNLTAEEDPTLQARNDGRMKLMTHLYANCRDLYHPVELDQLNDRIAKYQTDKQQAQAKIDEIEKALRDMKTLNEKLRQDLIEQKADADKRLKESMENVARQTGGRIREKSPGIWEIIGSVVGGIAKRCVIS